MEEELKQELSKSEQRKLAKEQRKEKEREEEKSKKALARKREVVYKRMVKAQKESLSHEKVAPENAFISLQNINKIYPNRVQAVFDFNLDIKEKEFIVFVGPSGCGKSTTLRMIAGLEGITGGDLYIDGVFANELEPKDRDVAMVFQSYALYPHMTVYSNMAFGLQMRHVPKEEIDERVKKAAEILELSDYLDRKPAALSGGQRQRVALGRAIVRNAKVFLMDEPLSNLDAKLRVQMRSEIVKLHNSLGSTTIYVTHDQTEAMTMASRIVVMKAGYIQQIGTPKEIYDHPSNTFVATFIGSPAMNILKAMYSKKGVLLEDGTVIPLTQELIKAHDEFYQNEILNAEKEIERITSIINESNQDNEGKKGFVPAFPEEDEEIIKLNEDIIYFKQCLEAEEHEILYGSRPEDIVDVETSILIKNPSKKINLEVSIAELLGHEYYVHLILGQADLIAKVNADKEVEPHEKIDVIFNLSKGQLFDVRSTKNINPVK